MKCKSRNRPTTQPKMTITKQLSHLMGLIYFSSIGRPVKKNTNLIFKAIEYLYYMRYL